VHEILSCQKIAESCRFVNRVLDEADTARNCISQLTDVIVELEAMEDRDEVFDSLLFAKDAKRGEEGKLMALNDGMGIFCSGDYVFSSCSLLNL
ncbi:hypothetical protein Tco_1512503, partial [Tanacetum coccineum]